MLHITEHLPMTKLDSNGTDIWTYLIDLTQSRDDLDGFAICPYLKRYIKQIKIQAGFTHINWACDQVIQGCPAVVLYEWNDHCEQIVDDASDRYHDHDIEILWMDPESYEPPLMIQDYTYRKHHLIIVQQASLLASARKQLEKSSYYKFWREDQ